MDASTGQERETAFPSITGDNYRKTNQSQDLLLDPSQQSTFWHTAMGQTGAAKRKPEAKTTL